MEGSKLLTGGELIQIWQLVQKSKPGPGDGEADDSGSRRVHFHLGDNVSMADPDDEALNQRLSFALDPMHHDLIHDPGIWECVWKCRPPTPVYHLQFSPDGFLFASAGKADRLVKIWYEDQKVQQGLMRSDSISPRKDVLHYSFIYISHPRAVTGFTWRKTSKYMPRGAVANMLVSSCLDNVSRIWVETILPDDGLVDLEQFDPNMSHDPKHHTHRHKKRFIQRLKTIRHAIHKRRKPKYGPETVMSAANLNAAASVHDFHRFAIHHNGVSPVLHFHLAGSINPETDIPLLPMTGSHEARHNFRLHWLDNKELQFTMEAEKLLQELHTKLMHDESITAHNAAHHGEGGSDEEEGEGEAEREHDHSHDAKEKDGDHAKKRKNKLFKRKKGSTKAHHADKQLGSHTDSQASLSSGQDSEEHIVGEISPSILERLDHNIELLLKEWQSSSDMLFSIHPVDGSFLVWLVEYLDETLPFTFRQAQVSFSSRLPHAIPIPDASTMACNLLLYCNYSRMDIKSAMRISEGEMLAGGGEAEGEGGDDANIHRGPGAKIALGGGVNADNMLIPNVLLVSKHHNGSLNQWQVSFTETSKFQTVVSVAHSSRVCGHRFRANAATCHPVLPLLLTTSHHNLPDSDATPEREPTPDENEDKTEQENTGSFAFCSELILWQPFGFVKTSCAECLVFQVNPVGPLSKAGGLMELARINSPSASAFTSLAWVPTLLPRAWHVVLDAGFLRVSSFVENFYLVVLERLSSVVGEEGSRLHMWRITISSQPSSMQGGDGQGQHAGMNGHTDGEEYNSDSDDEEARLFQESQYRPCFAPYLLVTACTDGKVRFWNCSVQEMTPTMRHENSFNTTSYEYSVGSDGAGRLPSVTSSQQWRPQDQDYEWREWQMMCSKHRSSAISIPGKPITVSCAYSGRIAVAYRYGDIRAQSNHPEEKFINLYVAIYECESTGGSDWVLEDTIELKNIKIPDPKAEIEISQVLLTQPNLPPGLSVHSNPFADLTSTPDLSSSTASLTSMTRTKSVPSLSTIQSGNKLGLLKQKCLVQLDWVSAEDGSHILTVSVGTKILTFTQVSNEKSKSLVVDDYQEAIRWMRLRVIELETADGLPPLPMHTSWVRAGILVVGMDNEIHVYTQWRGMLPQYHPKQLTALLSFGKIRRVKAILAHLLRSIIGSEKMQAVYADSMDDEEMPLRTARGRTLSASGTNADDADGQEGTDFPDFLEVSSIPPLPIYALLTADADITAANAEITNVAGTAEQAAQQQDYTDLFNTNVMDDTDELELLSSSEGSNKKKRTAIH
nr:hypothetical protein BaRGS_013475 [Batillaria attramentaria]